MFELVNNVGETLDLEKIDLDWIIDHPEEYEKMIDEFFSKEKDEE